MKEIVRLLFQLLKSLLEIWQRQQRQQEEQQRQEKRDAAKDNPGAAFAEHFGGVRTADLPDNADKTSKTNAGD